MISRIVFHILARILLITGISVLSCVPVAFIYNEAYSPFIYSSILSLMLAMIMHLSVKRTAPGPLGRREAYLLVTLAWVMMSLIGTLPYLLSGSIPNFTDALFESVSGFSTTGSSILTDIEILPKSVLFWRSLTHWVGGIGIIVMVIILMPSLNIGGYNLFTLESSLQEKIHPRIQSVGKRLLYIYLTLTLLEILFLLAGGMNLFESVCHSFGTVATGGFSPKNTSIIDYSPYIQYVIMIFMLLAGTNFVIHYYLVKREFSKIKQNEEMKFYLLVVLMSGLIIAGILYFQANRTLEPALRESFFQVISIVTCTGFASSDYLLWPMGGWVLIFALLFFGGCTGSTAGGIKMARHLIALKNVNRIIRTLTTPNAVIPLRFNHQTISHGDNNGILTFILWYMILFIIGTLFLVLAGSDMATSSSSVATAMGGIGPGFGTVGPVSTFAHLPQASKIALSALMLLGRLEIYTIVMLFTPWFWKK